MTEAEKAYQYFVIAVPESEEQAKAYFWARKALQPTLTPPNEPLTLEQLQEMDGEPVWVVPIGKCKWATRQWCVLAADEALIPGVDHWWWPFEGYGETWIAYCRPPEGEEDA